MDVSQLCMTERRRDSGILSPSSSQSHSVAASSETDTDPPKSHEWQPYRVLPSLTPKSSETDKQPLPHLSHLYPLLSPSSVNTTGPDLNSSSKPALPPVSPLIRSPSYHLYRPLKSTPKLDPVLSPPSSSYQRAHSFQHSPSPPTDLHEIIEKCSSLCKDLSAYKNHQGQRDEEERELLFKGATDTAHHILETLQSLDRQLSNRKRSWATATGDESPSQAQSQTSSFSEEFDDSEYRMIRRARKMPDQTRSKYQRRNKRSLVGLYCHSCQTTETPEWRRGPDGARTLCNACGLHYSKLLRKGSLTVQPQNHSVTGVGNSLSHTPHTGYRFMVQGSSPGSLHKNSFLPDQPLPKLISSVSHGSRHQS
ncbi:uncharacterized protein BYT42DRAFT_384070 [Radiomyces spectabilis]|uniref:uncharacterized protein n=1 Tax=Radiomyces spectabilis TaxID=64574 RepID=UPI0022200DC0|nr:uncharacterized protein BYT42DRAFT_384070 [Radiomyces spectabilis]KAI8376354.1 hypothetical protein BYT42DRAFT_384070 [Radiomyces spectabilis]